MNNIVNLMDKIKNPGAFSVFGEMEPVSLGLSVKGVGTISLPICTPQANAIINVSQQAPFGRGEETIVDTRVRKVWQIAADDFEIKNPEWDIALANTVKIIGKELGLSGCDINVEQYKLLLYEKGSFFTRHRDTEKVDNMFATLVINLPSQHTGGELVVSHGGESKTYAFYDRATSEFNPAFAAFYADCYHEVKEVTSGYRVCLVYNLSIADRKSIPALSQQFNIINDVEVMLKQWFKKKTGTPIFTYLLEHHYSERNLSLQTLKNGDFPKASVLFDAANKNNYQAYLCLVSYYRNSYGENIQQGRYHYYQYELSESDFEEYDVSEEETYAHAFINGEGKRVPIKKVCLDEDDAIYAKTPLLEGPGREVSILEATGNEGATKELWYHRGAVMIWLKDDAFEMTNRMDIGYSIELLNRSIENGLLSNDNDRKKIMRLASDIINKHNIGHDDDIASALMHIADQDLLKNYFLKQLNSYSLLHVNGKALLQTLALFNLDLFEEEVLMHLTPDRDVFSWILSLLLNEKGLMPQHKAILSKWVTLLWQQQLEQKLTKDNITHIVQIISLLNLDSLVDDINRFITDKIGSESSLFMINKYGPAIVDVLHYCQEKIYSKTSIEKFAAHCRQLLEARFSCTPAKPLTLSREGKLTCKCEFCRQVNVFLPKADRSEIIFSKTLKRNMVHVASQIKASDVDVDIEISKDPPKFKGVLKKNNNRYNRASKIYQKARSLITSLSF